jgi:photosystem II stability/assembly factor-like uncharacterized protein
MRAGVPLRLHVATILCAVCLVASAQTAQAGINVWTSHGPASEAVGALAIAPTNPTTLYVSAGGDGVFKSTDGGDTWSATGLHSSVAALTIDPATPTTLYAETQYGGGVFKSADGGDTWSATGLDSSVYALAIDPVTPGTLYAVRYDHYGVIKSTDGGHTGSATGLTSGVYALAIDPVTPGTLYAASPGGLIKSTDGGGTWFAINTDLPRMSGSSVIDDVDLSISPVTPTTLYIRAHEQEQDCDTIGCLAGNWFSYKSTDGGGSWSGIYFPAWPLVFDPVAPGTLYAVFAGDLHKSTDGGDTWYSTDSTGFRARTRSSSTPRPRRRCTPGPAPCVQEYRWRRCLAPRTHHGPAQHQHLCRRAGRRS